MRNRILLVISIGLIYISALSQISTGAWRDHLPYHEANLIVEAGNKIFCATPYSLFHYNKDDESISKLSKIHGLNDIKPCALAYSKEKETLIVAYKNANIDIITKNRIYNFDDIKQKNLQSDKKIYHININNDKAYFSCGFGIIVFDIIKKEITDTYYIGENASPIAIYGTAINGNIIYAATQKGIYYANMNNSNLADYHEWHKVTNIDSPNGKYNSILSINSQLLVNYIDEISNKTSVFKIKNSICTKIYSSETSTKKIRASNKSIFIIDENKITVLNSNLTIDKTIDKMEFGNFSPNDCIKSKEGKIYIADKNYALLIQTGNGFKKFRINSPLYNHVSDIDASANKVCVVGGGKNSYWENLWRYAEMYEFKNEQWTSNVLWDNNARDFVKVLINPNNTEQVYAASWGKGIFLFENNKLTATYDDTNSTLETAIAGKNPVNIGGMTFDNNQNLYVTNSMAESSISVKTKEGKWYKYKYPDISNYDRMGEIINTQYGHKWVQLGRGGIFAFDDNNTYNNTEDDKYRLFSLFDANGNVESNEVLSIAEDLDGTIWVGTSQGILTYFNPQKVFSSEGFYADRIKVVDNAADTLVQYLLAKERVTAIAIDGANRKWFGTENSGVFLMSEDGREEIFHFTTENSKLISNTIKSIAVNENTGEVFFGTNEGIVSYKGTAIKGKKSFESAYIYPNPVRADYKGQIIITGLVENVNVKITDVTGNLVYETTAFGGQAIWNGKNYSGNKVHTGVYLIFCTDEQGEQTKVLKLLVIN